MNTICILFIHYMHTICTLFVHYIHTICILFVHNMHTICTIFIYYMHTICILFAHYINTVCILILCPHYVYTYGLWVEGSQHQQQNPALPVEFGDGQGRWLVVLGEVDVGRSPVGCDVKYCTEELVSLDVG